MPKLFEFAFFPAAKDADKFHLLRLDQLASLLNVNHKDSMFLVFVMHPTSGKSTLVPVAGGETTVKEVAAAFAQKTRLPAYSLRLQLCKGPSLECTATLREAGLANGGTVHALFALLGGMHQEEVQRPTGHLDETGHPRPTSPNADPKCLLELPPDTLLEVFLWAELDALNQIQRASQQCRLLARAAIHRTAIHRSAFLERHLSTKPTISERVEVLLKDCIEKNQISVHLGVWEIKKGLRDLHGQLSRELEVDKDATATYLIREAQKATALTNKEELYAGDEREQRARKRKFLRRIVTYCDERVQLDAVLASGTSTIAWALTKLAKEKNGTTTYLGMYLAGTQEFKAAVDRSRDPDSSSSVKRDSLEARIADAAVSIAHKDSISGYKAKSKRFAADPVSKGNMDRRGKEGEVGVEQLLQASGLQAGSDYTTEMDRVISEFVEHPEGDRATPDFLFDPPLVIHGKDIRWIDVKNSLCIPDVSLDSQSGIKLQAQKYVKRFGQGAFVWTKCGFTESLDKFFDMPGVINLSFKLRTGRRPAPNSI